MDMLEKHTSQSKSSPIPLMIAAVLFGGLSQIGNIAGQNINSELLRLGYSDKNGNPLKGEHVFFATVIDVAPEQSINVLNTRFSDMISFTLRTEFNRNVEVTANLLSNNESLNNRYYKGQRVKVKYSEDNGSILLCITPESQDLSSVDFKFLPNTKSL